MMRFSFILLTLLVLGGIAAPTFAQQQEEERRALRGTVSGTVVDAETGDPIPSATVALRSAADSSLVTGEATGDDGAFTIENVRPGRYYVQISFVGYESQTLSGVVIGSEQQETDLGEIALVTDTAMLDEVEVTGERPYMEASVDRNIYNVAAQPVAAGGSALEALEMIPSIQVDINGSISLRGSEGVSIYLNGRPAPMTGQALAGFLNSLSAAAIERIEVIPTPSARYEPEGMSGIINIVLARDREGTFGGGVSAAASTNDEYRGSTNLHYGTGPWRFFANYGLRYDSGRESAGSQFRENRFMDPVTYLDQDMSGRGDGFSHFFRTSADYQFSEASTLSLSGLVSRGKDDGEDLNTYAELDEDRTVTHRYNRRSLEESSDLSMEYRLSFQHVIVPGEHELSAEAEYETDRENGEERYIQQVLAAPGEPVDAAPEEEEFADESEHEQEFEVQVDYQRPLGEHAYLEAGYEGALERQESSLYAEVLDPETGTFVPDTERNNAFVYDEQFHSAYGIIGVQPGAFGAQLGLRTERAITDFNLAALDESYGNNYFSFFPSVHLSYQPAEQHTLRLGYSKRVDRPNTWQLNPIGDYDDPTSLRVGNPDLKPEYTHAFELSYTYIHPLFTLSAAPYYRYTVNAISWNERLTDEGVTVSTFENFATRNSGGLELAGTLNLGEWLRTNASFNLYRRVTDGSNLETSVASDAIGYSTRLSATATLRPGLDLQLSQFYRSPMDVPGGHVDAFTATDLALQQELLGGRASLSLHVNDLFDTMGRASWRETERYYQRSVRDWDAQSVRLSLRYNFGQGGDERGGGRRRGR